MNVSLSTCSRVNRAKRPLAPRSRRRNAAVGAGAVTISGLVLIAARLLIAAMLVAASVSKIKWWVQRMFLNSTHQQRFVLRYWYSPELASALRFGGCRHEMKGFNGRRWRSSNQYHRLMPFIAIFPFLWISYVIHVLLLLLFVCNVIVH